MTHLPPVGFNLGVLAAMTFALAAIGAPAEPAAFVATSPADDQPTGMLVKLTADGSAELATPAGAVTVSDLIGLRRGTGLPPFPLGPGLLTTSGDRIPGTVLGGTDEAVRFDPEFTDAEWDVPLSAVSVLWVVKPPADTPADPARYSWLQEARNRDVLRFRNGDTAVGTLAGLTADPPGVRFKPDTGETRTVPLAELSAVAFNPTIARRPRPKGSFARLVLRDGTRLAVTGATANAGTLKGKTLYGQAVTVPVADLVGLDVMQGKAVYLADLKPKRVEQAGFLGTAWPWAADRTVHGTQLRLLTPDGEATFDRGLGTHPRTTLVYDLAEKYRRFEALVGLDAATGTRGRAAVRILVDGKEQDRPDLLKLAAGPAVPVRVDVVGAKELTLVVDFGPGGDVQADVDWADARLIGN